MALVDIEGGSGFRQAGTSLAKKLQSTVSDAGASVRRAAEVAREPAKQSTYQWYDDGTPEGAYYDPTTNNVWKNGTWWNADGNFWDGSSWASPAAMQAAIEHDQAIANTFGALPPEGATSDTTGAFRSPRRSFSDVALMLASEPKQKPTLSEMIGSGLRAGKDLIEQANTYRLPTVGAAQLAEDQQRAARAQEIGQQLGGVHAISPDSRRNLAGQALGAANRYFFDPIAETGAQLTPSLIKGGFSATVLGPAFDLASKLSPVAGGYDINKAESAGLRELGSAIQESGGNPAEFARIQQENLRERPLWQQMAASAVYDPTNLIGAGIATKALKSAEGAGTLSRILRGLGTANEYIDVAQAKAGREVMGGVAGALANQVAGGESQTGLNPVEAGLLAAVGGHLTRGNASLPSRALSKLDPLIGRTVPGGASLLGPDYRRAIDTLVAAAKDSDLRNDLAKLMADEKILTVDDLATRAAAKGPEGQRIRSAILGIADSHGGGKGPAASALSAAVRKSPVPALGAVAGYHAAPEDAMPLERVGYAIGGALAGTTGEFAVGKVRDLHLKHKPISLDLGNDAPIAVGLDRPSRTPVKTKIGNAIKNRVFLGQYSDDPRVLPIARDYAEGKARVASQANVFAEAVDARLRSVFDMDEAGRVRGLPYLDDAGGVMGDGPDIQQIAAVLPLYRPLLSEPQLAALDYADRAVREIGSVRSALDMNPLIPARGVMEGGFYLPRGKSTRGVEDIGPLPFHGGKPGGVVSTEKPRKFETKLEGEVAGREYVPFAEALRNYASEQLGKAWDFAAAEQLIDSGLGIAPNAQLSPQIASAMKEIRRDIADTAKRIGQVDARLRRENTVGRITDRDLRKIERRSEELVRQMENHSVGIARRRDAARETSALARAALNDALGAALADARKFGAAGERVKALFERGQKLNRDLERLEDQLREAAGLGEVKPSGAGVRLPKVDARGLDMERLVKAATLKSASGRRTARQLRDTLSEALGLPYGDAVASDIAASASAKESARAVRLARTKALDAARKEAMLAPDERLAAIESEQRALDRRYKELSERASRTGARAAELTSELESLHVQVQIARAKSAGLRSVMDRAMAEAADRREGLVEINLAPLAGWKWAPELANTFNKRIPRPKGNHLSVEVLDAVNDSMRALQATGDGSAIGIQLIRLAFTEPAIVAKAAKEAIASMSTPEALGRYILKADADALAKSEPLVSEMAKYGTYFSTGELTTAAHGRTSLTHAIETSPLVGTKVLQPTNRIFDNMGNFSRIDLFKSLWRAARDSGVDPNTPEQMAAIAKAVNLATGYAPRTFLGGPIGSRVQFAGRFFQSVVETIGTAATNPHIEGAVAREQLARMAGIGTLLTVAANSARGIETDFDPRSPNFLRVRNVFGHDISVFGPWDSLVRGIASGDPKQFARSKASPIVSTAWDIWEGKDFLGRPVRGSVQIKGVDVPYVVPQRIGERLLPFSMVGIAEEITDTIRGRQSPLDAVVGSVAQVAGVKASQLTEREKYELKMADAWKAYEPSGYTKPESPEEDPLFIKDFALKHPDDVPAPVSEIGKKLARAEATFEKNVASNDLAAMSGVTSDGRDWTIGDWKTRRRELLIARRQELADILGEPRDKAPREGTPAYWLQTYFDTFDRAQTDVGLNLEKLDSLQAEWLEENGPQALKYVQSYTSLGDSAIERGYFEAIQKLKADGYFMGQPNSMPRFLVKVSELEDEEIIRLANLVSEESKLLDPAYAGQSFAVRSLIVLDPRGYSIDEITDVANSQKTKNMHYNFWLYKERNPGLLAWLDNSNHYTTITALAERKTK